MPIQVGAKPTPAETNSTRDAALDLAARGWPILPVKPSSKEPLTPNGVKDATTDERTILHWLDRWPDANIAIACGAPGPTVLDVDDPDQARSVLAGLHAHSSPPEVATARGRHLYFAGTTHGTISLGYGELRGRGHYVVAPPSIHPSGKSYTWLSEPNGPLPKVPADLIPTDRHTAGAGVQEPRTRVPHGQRHDYLKDTAVRLLRAGITDSAAIARHLEAEYDAVCDPHPPARPGEFTRLAEWATSTQIAQRERERKRDTSRGTSSTEETPGHAAPGFDAPLAQHKHYVGTLGGWAPHLDIVHVERFGNKLVDALIIHLTNDLTIEFARQGDVTVRGAFNKAVIAGTNGLAAPRQLKDFELNAVYRSLCILAGAPAGRPEAEDHEELLADLLALCEHVLGHSTQDAAAIYTLIEALRARPEWDPGDRHATAQPALITDSVTDERFVRAGELHDYFRHRGAGIATREFPGRMSMIGLQRVRLNGREPRTQQRVVRRTNTALMYRLPRRDNEGVPQDA